MTPLVDLTEPSAASSIVEVMPAPPVHSSLTVSDHTVFRNSALQETDMMNSIIACDVLETLPDILHRLASSIDCEGRKNIVNVDRDNVLEGGFRALQRRFDEHRLLNVRFTGEDGADSGGLTREFLRLAVRELQSGSLFTGHCDKKFLQLDYNALSKCHYVFAGRLMALSLMHGPLPNFLHPLLYAALSEGYECARPTIQDVTVMDLEMGNHLSVIGAASSETEFHSAVAHVQDIAVLAGCAALLRNVEQKDALISSLCHFVTIGRAVMAIEQFKEGLRTLGIMEEIRRQPAVMHDAFVFTPRVLDATVVEDLFTVEWSPRGSNNFRVEKTSMTHFRDFLQDAEGTGQLEKLLVFTTGLDSLPALGFNPQPTIEFEHSGEFPKSNTCSNMLRLPCVSTYEDFSKNMTAALDMCCTFTDM